jgi:orotate phosphoribosyltransferase
MNYRSVADMNEDVRNLAESVPEDVDLVVGIPRSGLLAANIMCLHLNVPMTDVEGLCEGRTLQTGRRYDDQDPATDDFADVDTVLVLDDSVNSGTQMRETRNRLADHDFPFDLEYAAVYISPGGYEYVDYWAETVHLDRMFEWNLLHHPKLGQCCVDIDGVLCRDPTPEENDDGAAYREFLRTVEPKVAPSEPIGWLVTCRLEKYREETRAWLDEHDIRYDELVMMDHPDKETRMAHGNHARYKAEVYEETGAKLFVESDPGQSTAIASTAGKPVYCYQTNEFLQPGTVASTYASSRDYLSQFVSNPFSFSVKASKFLLSRSYHRLNRSSRSSGRG